MSQKSFLVFFLCAVLNGCGIGGYWMNGNPFYASVKPYMSLWHKDGMTEESQRVDWVKCGGSENGNFSSDARKDLPGESPSQGYDRQSIEHQRCLIRLGYRYTGNCSSPALMTKPLCGGSDKGNKGPGSNNLGSE